MHFLYPAFLFALATLAIPVIVHLFNFRRYKKVYFSNVQFLKEVQEQQASRRNLKERLILAARVLALFFLVLAFAEPFIPVGDNNAGKQRAVSIFIDNSYSMQTLSAEGTLLDEAKQKARQIAAAYGVNDRFQLLTQDFEGKHQRLLNRDEFYDAVDAVKISAQSRTLGQITARQQSLFNTQPGMAAQSFIISDFQRNLEGADRIKTDLTLSCVKLTATQLPNVAVDSVWMLNATHRPGETEKLVIKLHNYAGKTAEKVPVKLSVNGAQKALASYTVNPRSVQNDTLSFSGLQAGWQRAQISLQDNPVVFDNQFYFSFSVNNKLPVLVVNGGQPNKYLNAVFASDAFFAPATVQDGNVNYASLANYSLVVLSDVKTISTGVAQQLQTYVKKGGSLLVFPAVDAELSSYRSLLSPMAAAYPQKLSTQSAKVSFLNLQSPVFKTVFEAMPQNPDLPLVQKYYSLTKPSGAGEYLMRLQNGESLWQRSSFGRGNVYVSAVALDPTFSNLPLHALFVPTVYRMALLAGHDGPLFNTIGNNLPVEAAPIQSTDKQLLTLVKGDEKVIPDARQQDGNTFLFLPGQLSSPGLYELKKGDSVAAVIAFNNNRSESDLTYLSDADLAKLSPKRTAVIDGNKLNANTVNMTANSGVQLWKLCIILALIFLAAETLLIRFFKTDKSTAVQPG